MENSDDLRGSLIRHENVSWHWCRVNQGQNRWEDVTAISLENYPRSMGGGQGTSRGQAHFREMASPAFENTLIDRICSQTKLGASHRTQTRCLGSYQQQ